MVRYIKSRVEYSGRASDLFSEKSLGGRRLGFLALEFFRSSSFILSVKNKQKHTEHPCIAHFMGSCKISCCDEHEVEHHICCGTCTYVSVAHIAKSIRRFVGPARNHTFKKRRAFEKHPLNEVGARNMKNEHICLPRSGSDSGGSQEKIRAIKAH